MEPRSTREDDRVAEAERFAREILPAVSRTFALSIRLLPGALGRAVRTAYLLCRIADTIEDEPRLPASEKAVLFDELLRCFDDPAAADAFPRRLGTLHGRPADVRLALHADLVFALYRSLSLATQAHVRRWVGEMIVGMRKFVLLYPHGIRIQSLDEYKEYCYYVAGTVGYLVTDLWHEHAPSIGVRRHGVLREKCRAFAEALQTVNILKDVASDAEQENSIYIPEELLRAHGSSHATFLAPERAQLPAPHPAPSHLDPALVRPAAAVRVCDAARSHPDATGARAPRGGEDLSGRGEVAHADRIPRHPQQPRPHLARRPGDAETVRGGRGAVRRAVSW